MKERGYTPHVRQRWEETQACRHGQRARRWVVERTFGWMTKWRRLVRDYEKRIDVSHAMILVAMGGNLILRNAHP